MAREAEGERVKYELEQMIFYMKENRIHSAPVLARMLVENAHDGWASTKEQKEIFTPFGPSRIMYATCHGLFREIDIAASKEELLLSLAV